jgi:hypothetical protein
MTPSPTAKALYRVIYRDGSTITTKAKSSVQAGVNAERTKRGAIKEIKFLRKLNHG